MRTTGQQTMIRRKSNLFDGKEVMMADDTHKAVGKDGDETNEAVRRARDEGIIIDSQDFVDGEGVAAEAGSWKAPLVPVPDLNEALLGARQQMGRAPALLQAQFFVVSAASQGDLLVFAQVKDAHTPISAGSHHSVLLAHQQQVRNEVGMGVSIGEDGLELLPHVPALDHAAIAASDQQRGVGSHGVDALIVGALDAMQQAAAAHVADAHRAVGAAREHDAAVHRELDLAARQPVVPAAPAQLVVLGHVAVAPQLHFSPDQACSDQVSLGVEVDPECWLFECDLLWFWKL